MKVAHGQRTVCMSRAKDRSLKYSLVYTVFCYRAFDAIARRITG
jgi:hypothetical protein